MNIFPTLTEIIIYDLTKVPKTFPKNPLAFYPPTCYNPFKIMQNK